MGYEVNVPFLVISVFVLGFMSGGMLMAHFNRKDAARGIIEIGNRTYWLEEIGGKKK